MLADFILPERDHLFRRVGDFEQSARRLVHARIRRLRREHNRDKQSERIHMLELALWLGFRSTKPTKHFFDLLRWQSARPLRRSALCQGLFRRGNPPRFDYCLFGCFCHRE